MLKHIRKDARRKAGAEGFTLIELLVVIVILGILAAVVVIAVGQIRDRGETSACETEGKAVAAAAALYYADQDPRAYAPDVQTLVDDEYIQDTPEYEGTWTYSDTDGEVDISGC